MSNTHTTETIKRKQPRLSAVAVDWIVLSMILTILVLQVFIKR
ncbi:hypothetical protein [Deminuibacter soli]|nr:hypothetical protein [Deminuibacter soli]